MTEEATKRCPYCGEKIKPTAIKCRHCGEWLVSDPPPTIKSPEEQAKEQEKQQEKKQQKKIATGCLIISLIVPVILIVILGLIAKWTVPDLEEHREEIREKAVKCAEDQAGDILSSFGGSVLKPLLSMAMNTETVQGVILEKFDKLNKIEYVPGTFWSHARIVNRIYPEGKTVSFGIFGMAFPSLDWDDFVLLDDKESDSPSSSSASSSPSALQQQQGEVQSTEANIREAPSTSASHQTYHGLIQGNIRCEFDLYFEPANDYGQQEVRGTYSYTSQGSRLIILHGWYNTQTDELTLTEYYDDGRANCSMRAYRTSEGFKGWFIRPNKNDLTLVMTE